MNLTKSIIKINEPSKKIKESKEEENSVHSIYCTYLILEKNSRAKRVHSNNFKKLCNFFKRFRQDYICLVVKQINKIARF